jgi:hypothetical protein
MTHAELVAQLAAAADRLTARVLAEIPITIRPRLWSRLPMIGRYSTGRWLRPTWGTAAQLVDVARAEIRDARRRGPLRPVVMKVF